MIRAIFFDLDGTLLPMDEKKFEYIYVSTLCKHLIPYGYDPKLVAKGLMDGMVAMFKNDGSVNNDVAFWNVFNQLLGKDCRVDSQYFDEYYKTGFYETKVAYGINPYAKEIVEFCKKNFEHVLLTTNPLFPAVATQTRIRCAGLEPDDFDFVTSFENFMFCKPNPKYFLTLLKMYNLKPEEVLVIGNNTVEDCECALACGIKSFLIKGQIIYDPRAKHEFEEVEPKDVIEKIKSFLNE